MDFYMSVFEARLKANSTQKYLVGEKLSVLDLQMVTCFVYGMILNESCEFSDDLKAVYEKHEDLKKYVAGIAEGELKEYLSSRPKGWNFWY